MGHSGYEAFSVMCAWLKHQIFAPSVGGFSCGYWNQCVNLSVRKCACTYLVIMSTSVKQTRCSFVTMGALRSLVFKTVL